MNLKHAIIFAMMIFGIFLTSCEEDPGLTPDPDEKQGKIELEITDAPVDDPAVKSVFVTIVDLQIDDQSLPDFSSVTLDLLTLQNGTTAVLGGDSIKVGSYGEIALILDPDECYVEDHDGNRHDLNPEDVKVELNHDFMVSEDSSVHLLVDFDLRKTIQRDLSDSSDRYDFVPSVDFVNGFRILDKNNAGQLTGQCVDVSTGSEMIIAYLYNIGEYNAAEEIEVADDSELQFKNAVTSAMVMDDGKYNFPFLKNGDYELHFASYEEDGNTGRLVFRGMLKVNASDVQDVLSINIASSSKTEIDLAVTGLLPL